MITEYQKNSFSIEFVVVDVDESGIKTPVDISNGIFTFIVKRGDDNSENDTSAVIKKIINLGVDSQTQQGIVTIPLYSSDMDIPVSIYNMQGQIESTTIELATVYNDRLQVLNNLVKE